MKRITQSIGFAAALAFGSALNVGDAIAQQPPAPSLSNDVKFTVGLKLWGNTWETSFVPVGAAQIAALGNNVVSSTSGTRWALIPNLSVNYRNFFGTVGYFTRTNYNFPNSSQVVGPPPFGDLATTRTSAKRSELDLNAGYWLLQGEHGGRLGVTLGYKEVDQRYTSTCCFNVPVFGPTTTDTSTTHNRGATLGLTGSAPIAGNWTIYANGAAGPMKAKEFSAKGYYASAEAGIAYPLGQGTTLSLGYKTQIIDLGINGQRARDTTNGVIFGVSHTF